MKLPCGRNSRCRLVHMQKQAQPLSPRKNNKLWANLYQKHGPTFEQDNISIHRFVWFIVQVQKKIWTYCRCPFLCHVCINPEHHRGPCAGAFIKAMDASVGTPWNPEIATIWMGSVVKAIEMVVFKILWCWIALYFWKVFKCHSRSLVTSF